MVTGETEVEDEDLLEVVETGTVGEGGDIRLLLLSVEVEKVVAATALNVAAVRPDDIGVEEVNEDVLELDEYGDVEAAKNLTGDDDKAEEGDSDVIDEVDTDDEKLNDELVIPKAL